MHLTLVPEAGFPPPFELVTDFDVTIPNDLPEDEDAMPAGTPEDLASLRYFFSAVAAGDRDCGEEGGWSAPLRAFMGTGPGGTAAIPSAHYAACWIGAVFAAWQAACPSRTRYALQLGPHNAGHVVVQIKEQVDA